MGQPGLWLLRSDFMRIIYSKIAKDTFWDQYWADIPKDPDKLSSPEDYPLFPFVNTFNPVIVLPKLAAMWGVF